MITQRVLLSQERVFISQISLNIFGAQKVLYKSCSASQNYFTFPANVALALTSVSLTQEIRNYFPVHNWIVNLLKRKQVH